MKIKLENDSYDTLLLPIEWRFSAALVGIVKYFEFVEHTEGVVLHEKTQKGEDLQVYKDIGGYIEGIKYNQSDITEERYLLFCESYFSDEFYHIHVKNMLGKQSYNEEEISNINKELKSNAVMKKVFSNIKFDGTNENVLLETIENNRFEIIKETYRYKTNLYRNFSNTNRLFTDLNPHCRLLGYDLDENRKSRSVAYQFDKDTFVAQDIIEFDFIPFAFPNTQTSFFVNNNYNIDVLCKTNNDIKSVMEEKVIVRDNKVEFGKWKTRLIKGIINSDNFMEYDVEVIMKVRGDDTKFESFYINQKQMTVLKKIYNKLNISFTYKYSYNYWLIVEEEVVNCCIRGVFLDNLLEKLLVISCDKEYANAIYIVNKLIDVNVDWKGVQGMNEVISRAQKTGYAVGQAIEKNKAKSYKNKLTNAIISHDYDRILEIMLQLSGYIGQEIGTIYDIIDYKDDYSDIAICFTNALVPYEKEDK